MAEMVLLLLSSLTRAGDAVTGVEARCSLLLSCLSSTRLGVELCAGRVHDHFD